MESPYRVVSRVLSTRRIGGTVIAAVAAVVVLALPSAAATPVAARPGLLAPLADVSATLIQQLAAIPAGPLRVLVHGTDLAAADSAVNQTGMRRITRFAKIGVVAALATPDQINAARSTPGVTYVEGDEPIRVSGTSSHVATRDLQARNSLVDPNNKALDGTGVSIALIDTGIDPTHPAFTGPNGLTRVVRNLKSLCLNDASTDTSCITDLPTFVDTDTLSAGGHGTHVAGIMAGNDETLSDGTKVNGAAPGAKIVSLSTGAGLAIIGADAALNWVLEHHAAPCGPGVSASACPPIKVVNNSYGPNGGGAFDPQAAATKLQRQLVAEGVVVVWANGNDGGYGSVNLSNPPGEDPTPGVLSVASYNDGGTGTRDGKVSTFSSRGAAAHPETWPKISAPGENILSSCRIYLTICTQGGTPMNGPGLLDIGTYNTLSGTSMATPHITGIVAQLFQAAPNATPADIADALMSTAYKYGDGAGYVPLGSYTSSYDKGTGLVDAYAAAVALGARVH